jgi:hypothetical protein
MRVDWAERLRHVAGLTASTEDVPSSLFWFTVSAAVLCESASLWTRIWAQPDSEELRSLED